MAYWVKKDNLSLPKYFNSLEKKTRIISRLIAFIVIFFITAFIKIYYYKFTWVEYRKFGPTYTNTGHSWNELYANLGSLLFESLIIAAVIVIVVHILDYFTKDKHPDLICESCFKIKNYDNDFKCQCGGKFVRKDSMEYYVDETEYKIKNVYENRNTRIYLRGMNYYKCLPELPQLIFCPGCLSEIKPNTLERKDRSYYCAKCRKDYDLSTPPEWIKNGKVKDEYKYGSDFILDGVLNVSSWDQWRINQKFVLLKKYKALPTLPEEIECPHCLKKIRLYRQEIINRKFSCSKCSEFLDLTFEKEKT
jgi:hypothetical protein